MSRPFLLIAALLLATPAARAQAPKELGPGDHRLWLNVGELLREYLVHVPQRYRRALPAPLVFVFHGSGGSLDEMAHLSGWTVKSEDQNFLVVYPNGFPNDEAMRVWNDGRPGMDPRQNDVPFVQAMLDELDRRFSVDHNRIYLVGFSNGAGLAYRLAIQLNDRIASFAAVAGGLHYRSEPAGRPVSAIIIAGTDDPGIAAEEAGARRWADFVGCDAHEGPPVTRGRYVLVGFQGCPRDVDVLFYRITGWGHYWPGGRNPGVRMWAENVIWRFFEQHPMKLPAR